MSPAKKLFLASLFYSGFAGNSRFFQKYFGWAGMKPGSGGGTAGSVVATAILAIPILLEFHWVFFLFIAVGAYVISPWLIIDAEKLVLNQNDGKPLENHKGEKVYSDFNSTVWDEFVGMIITLMPLAAYSHKISWLLCLIHLIFGLIVFRILDTTKPLVIGRVESYYKKKYYKYQGRLKINILVVRGIMLDDVFAGIFASIIACFVIMYFHQYTNNRSKL